MIIVIVSDDNNNSDRPTFRQSHTLTTHIKKT